MGLKPVGVRGAPSLRGRGGSQILRIAALLSQTPGRI